MLLRWKKIFIVIGVLVFLFSLMSITQAAENATTNRLDEIVKRGYIRVGTTGDFKPMTFYDNAKGIYQGHDIDAAQSLGSSLGVEVRFVETTWPTLMQDLLADKFDIAMSGITRTFARQKVAALSTGYIKFGKIPLIRKANQNRFVSLETIDLPTVKIGVNPGGTNEKFVRENLKHANIIVYERNLDIPHAVARGEVDVMITDSMEAIRYAKEDARLYAALTNQPFTQNKFGFLMQRDDQIFINYVNMWLEEMELRGVLAEWEHYWIQ